MRSLIKPLLVISNKGCFGNNLKYGRDANIGISTALIRRKKLGSIPASPTIVLKISERSRITDKTKSNWAI